MWLFLPLFYGYKHSQVYDAGCCCRWVQTSKANLRTVWIGLDRPLVFLPSFGYLQTNGTAQNMGRASPWAADLTEAAALLFSSSRVPMVNSSPHHPLRLSLSILPSPVVLLILGTCFVLHTARRFYIVLSSRTEHCWRAGEKAGIFLRPNRQGVRWSILFCLTGQIALFHLLDQICYAWSKRRIAGIQNPGRLPLSCPRYPNDFKLGWECPEQEKCGC